MNLLRKSNSLLSLWWVFMKSKLKPLFSFTFPLVPSQKRDWEILYFETNSIFTAVQMYWLQIYYWLTAARGEIPGFIYVHRCFWKVYFLYFVLPANLIYHLLPWKHGLFPPPPPSKTAAFQFSLCYSAACTNPCIPSASEHGAHLEYSTVH